MLALFLVACTLPTPGKSDVPGGPSYYADVKPILDANCVNCHVDGGVAPFPLVSWEQVEPMKAQIADAVATRRMPPWLAAPGCTDYRDDLSLTEAEIAAVTGWAETGGDEGDPDDDPRVAPEQDRTLSRVDVSMSMRSAYTPVQSPDDYRCFLFDWPETESTFITGFRPVPGNTQVVHHVVAYLSPPEQADAYELLDAAEEGEGYTCFGGPGVGAQEDAQWLGGWAPGGASGDFPNGTGIAIEPGSKIVLQVHYNTDTVEPAPDLTQLDVMISDEVESPAMIQPWANPLWLDTEVMEIPPNSTDTVHGFTYEMWQPFQIHTANLHMHTRGTSARLWIDRVDGTQDCMLDIPRWDFGWQRTYVFAEPKQIEVGDSIHVECHWDNPTDTPIYWGEGTGDEMCLGTMLFSY